MDATFRALRPFNQDSLSGLAKSRQRIDPRIHPHFPSDSLVDRVVRALAEARALPLKEVVESFEFHARVRRRLRHETIVDACGGHGLTGLLFALLDRQVERVRIVDRRRPDSFGTARDALASVAPWVAEKVEYLECTWERAGDAVPPGASIVGVHACGGRTDRILETAMERRATVAVMPCCYGQTASRTPAPLRRELGDELATDIDRTYRLRAQGYDVDWTAIPRAVSGANRILVATP